MMMRQGRTDSNSRARSVSVLISVLLFVLLPISMVAGDESPPASLAHGVQRPTTPGLRSYPHPPSAALYRGLPLIFEANAGQTDPSVKFLSRGPGYTLFLTPTEAALALTKSPADANATTKATLLRMKLVGANSRPPVSGLEALPGKVNYFIGDDPKQWRTNVPTYAKVKYEGVYPGVDLVYYGDGRQLEYDFVVAPGSDPKAIALAFDGADKLEVDAQGDLVLAVDGGELRLRKPLVYQDVDGHRKPIAGNYILKPRSRVGIQVAAYDATKPLVIDPVLIYSTDLGGSGTDRAFAIAVDGAGNAYVTGDTISIDFPTKAPYQSALGKSTTTDCFVTKMNTTVPVGPTSLVYSTYLGGSGSDQCFGIAINSSGNAFVTGQTNSTNFPGSALSKSKGGGDIFVVKLNPAGSALSYSAFLGGSAADTAAAIAVDGAGNAYVTGKTTSKDFPVVGGFQASPGVTGGDPSGDAFVTKLNALGTAILYSTYLGGSAADEGRGIAVDISGNAYVTGTTSSTSGFPLKGALDSSLGGSSDAFVTKVNTAATGGGSLVYSTYLGGGCAEEGRAIAVDASGSAYVTGRTFSTDFPGAVTGFQTTLGEIALTCGASGDAFVAKLNPAGSALSYSTYLGGAAADLGLGIAVDGNGNAYVTGQTFSTDFPTPGGFATGLVAPSDAFVTRIDTKATGALSLVYSTLLGDTSAESAFGIALDNSGYVYVTGQTCLPPSTCSTTGIDAFVAKLSTNAKPTLAPIGDKSIDEEKQLTFTAVGFDADPAQTLTYSLVDGTTSCGSVTSCVVPAAGANGVKIDGTTGAFTWTPTEAQGPGTYRFKVVVTDNGSPSLSASEEITVKVNEVNTAPTLAPIGNKSVDELALLTFTAVGSDTDSPTQALTYSLVDGTTSCGSVTSCVVPAAGANGAKIDGTTGVFTWTPTEAQGPGTYRFKVVVTDNGSPSLSASEEITVTVNELNTAPVLTVPVAPQTVTQGLPLTFSVSATDADRNSGGGQLNTLTYSIKNGFRAGMSLNASTGAFSWTAPWDQPPGDYSVTFLVTDDGTPALSSEEKTVTITVKAVLTVPGQLPPVNEGQQLTFRVADVVIPPNTWTFSATNLPPGATFNPVTQTFDWTPNSAQGGTQPYLVSFTVSGGQFVDAKQVSITVLDNCVDTDGDGVPDACDLDGNGIISPAGVRNSKGQFETDNCPNDFNPDQFDVCHNSAETASAVSLVAASGSSGGALNLTLKVTFTGGTTGKYVLPVNLFNSICRLVDNATGQQVPVGGVPEGPPINLSPITVGGDLVFVPGGSSLQTATTFDLKLFYPNLADGSYTILCDYVNFAHDPQGDAPPTWTGKLSAPAQTVYNGQYLFSGFFSPADHEPFNQGRTVPVKFTLATSSGVPFTTATVKLLLQRLNSQEQPDGDPIPATSSDASIGNVVPYNTAEGQYHYNMRTSPLAIGLWQLQAQLDDGTTKVITIVIR
jgi:hypothetical protein